MTNVQHPAEHPGLIRDDEIDAVRRDFPILASQMRGKELAYLDNGATSLTPIQVMDAEKAYYEGYGANIHRGIYELSERASEAYHSARMRVMEFIGAGDDSSLVFTRGTTESINLLVSGWADIFVTNGDEVLVSEMEHHANLVPWQELCARRGATLRHIPVDPVSGEFDMQAAGDLINARTRIVAVSGMSNVTGYQPDIRRLADMAHAAGALISVDGAQLVSHTPVNVQELGVDFLSFSAHKMLGPTGIGAFWARMEHLSMMKPFQYGGDMISHVYLDRAEYQEPPERFEAGTPNIAGAIGFARAVDYLSAIGMERIAAHEDALLEYARDRAAERDDLMVYGQGDKGSNAGDRGGIFSFNLKGIHPHDTGTILDQRGIAVRTGYHCAEPFMHILGAPGTVRASFYLYNTVGEIDRLFAALDDAKMVFG